MAISTVNSSIFKKSQTLHVKPFLYTCYRHTGTFLYTCDNNNNNGIKCDKDAPGFLLTFCYFVVFIFPEENR